MSSSHGAIEYTGEDQRGEFWYGAAALHQVQRGPGAAYGISGFHARRHAGYRRALLEFQPFAILLDAGAVAADLIANQQLRLLFRPAFIESP